MTKLKVTLIDVGWGDSILIEIINKDKERIFGLIDSNDSVNFQSSYIYIKRYLEREKIEFTDKLFKFIILSHAHSDHGQGLIKIMRKYGTENFCYSKCNKDTSLIALLRFAKRSKKVEKLKVLDNSLPTVDIEGVKFDVLWPPNGRVDSNENNNSIVLLISLLNIKILLTGDIELGVWDYIKDKIPDNDVHFLKIPHHGSANGTVVERDESTPLLDKVGNGCKIGISTHRIPYEHPDEIVIKKIREKNLKYFRTDYNHNICISTYGRRLFVNYSR